MVRARERMYVYVGSRDKRNTKSKKVRASRFGGKVA